MQYSVITVVDKAIPLVVGKSSSSSSVSWVGESSWWQSVVLGEESQLQDAASWVEESTQWQSAASGEELQQQNAPSWGGRV